MNRISNISIHEDFAKEASRVQPPASDWSTGEKKIYFLSNIAPQIIQEKWLRLCSAAAQICWGSSATEQVLFFCFFFGTAEQLALNTLIGHLDRLFIPTRNIPGDSCFSNSRHRTSASFLQQSEHSKLSCC